MAVATKRRRTMFLRVACSAHARLWSTEEKYMITKALLCGCVFGCLAAFAAMLDRGHVRVLDSLVQIPACGAGETGCQHTASPANASTERFFAMLAMH